jgi:SAM-dependent methyltransferase
VNRDRLKLELTVGTARGLAKSGPTDPIEHYTQPLVGWLYRERINMGLRLLSARRFRRVLEVGYGAGALLVTLASHADELHGIDSNADPAPLRRLLGARELSVRLAKGSVCELPYESGAFNLVCCFSVFEHLSGFERGLSEVARVLAPGGLFLLGMPSVNRIMRLGFLMLGERRIEDEHVTTPGDVAAAFASAGLRVVRSRRLAWPVPPLSLYHTWLLERSFG